MPLSDQARLDADRAAPRLIELHVALARLRSCVSFMNSGAHPDDETSAMLAAISLRDGLDISYACANRGEGGQNDIGTETNARLGTLRTAEMERAAAVLGLRLYWLSEHPDDSIFDAGFSKSGEETLQHWGYERTLQRFVKIVRRERPDILCPTFLDIPGQHGHHRAMTLLASEVMSRAADPAFEAGAEAPWQIAKLYLPAWGGGGSAYDDELPPPPETLRVHARGRDTVTGWSYENLGQHSRRFHLTQGMGRWVAANEERDWPLHLQHTTVAGPDTSLVSGLPATLATLADTVQDITLRQHLKDAQSAIDAALAAYPNMLLITESAFDALASIQQAHQAAVILENSADVRQANLPHRLTRKQAQLAEVIKLASGTRVRAWLDRDVIRPGQTTRLRIDAPPPEDASVCLDVSVLTDSNWTSLVSPSADSPIELSLAQPCAPSNPYPDTWLPHEPQAPCLQIQIERNGVRCLALQPFDVPPVIASDCRVQLEPNAMLLNTLDEKRELDLQISRRVPEDAEVQLVLPTGWHSAPTELGAKLNAPPQLHEGLHEITVQLGKPASTETLIHYPHISPRVFTAPAVVRVRATAIQLPDVRVGYIGSGNDRVAHWLSNMGVNTRVLTDMELADPASLGNALSQLDTLVIGVFAYRMRPGLSELASSINAWVDSGGHLLTLYHRPWDAWDPDHIPPRRLEIGQPSLRFRVTDQNATVTYLTPQHPLLNTPNIIGEEDWQDWHKERGLYFAKSWDAAYVPLLSMADPGEDAHQGALLCATVGKGRHVHTSLILHHQMEHLVPGSFRLMANLVS